MRSPRQLLLITSSGSQVPPRSALTGHASSQLLGGRRVLVAVRAAEGPGASCQAGALAVMRSQGMGGEGVWSGLGRPLPSSLD